MANTLLPSTIFDSSKPARMMQRNTLIEDTPQISSRRAPPPKIQSRPFASSPLSDSFPTPRAIEYASMDSINEESRRRSRSPADSDTESEYSSTSNQRDSTISFDEMYDVTESESEGEVPIKLSMSVKKRQMAGRPNRLPSLVIPSPSEWPTIDKMKSVPTPLSPPLQISLARSVLAQLQLRDTPSSSAAPSLDGSATDEELALSSCPSTPDIAQHDNEEQPWEVPIQLDPTSISLLEHISGEDPNDLLETVIEIPEEAVSEMREIVESPPVTARMRLDTQNLIAADPEDELSALSVPSPGIFFASLDSSVARRNWSGIEPAPAPSTGIATEFYDVPFRMSAPAALLTSTATSFYDLPWQQRPENPIEHTIFVDSLESRTDPITARKVAFSPTEDTIEEVNEVDEMDETYHDTLQETASANFDRTQSWLTAQSDYLQALLDEETEADDLDSFKDIEDAVPRTPELTSPVSMDSPPSKKSVRFVDDELAEVDPKSEAGNKRISPIHDGTFWDGWRHTKRSQRARDAFQHRQARAEAEHVKRISGQKQHLEQLHGKFEIVCSDRPAPQRPISALMPIVEADKHNVIAHATRERQALRLMQASSWHLAAQKEVSGGKLLTSPVVQSCKGRRDVRILDLAGQVHCGWAWDIALEHPDSTVYTTVPSDAEAHVAALSLEGPSNHTVVAAPKPWELPFEDNYFDVISTRSLYSLLKTVCPQGETADEWDLTLRECLRCLKTGGYLEFDLLDAELVHPDSAGQALSVEFAFNLKTRGYDPSAGKTFLPRLKRAGFQSIKRAWMVLPVADVVPRWVDSGKNMSASNGTPEKSIGPNGEVLDYEPPVTGSTRDVRAITGLAGSRVWEQWIVKLNNEMGRSDERCLEQVAQALQEGGKGITGWRCLVGWARKEM